jgi:hypothetical protein
VFWKEYKIEKIIWIEMQYFDWDNETLDTKK